MQSVGKREVDYLSRPVRPTSHAALMSASWLGSLIQATVGSFGGDYLDGLAP